MLVRLKLAGRVAVRARHFGALPDLALNTDLLTIVPQMYAANLVQRHYRHDIPAYWRKQMARPADAPVAA